MAEKLSFTAWQRSQLFDRAQKQGARLASSVELTLRDTETGQVAGGAAPFALLAAADIAGLKAGAIKHRAPAPLARDAETTKFVHVDFWEADLPWRYTPEREADRNTPPDPDNKTLRPWLVLLVGTGEEIDVQGRVANVRPDVLQAHPLSQSHLWAHTQFDGHTTIGRILSPRTLLPQREYVAVLVPAFNDAGQPMWRDDGSADFGRQGVLTALDQWRFWTAEAGDFETLAAALRIPPAGDVGKARLHYRRHIPADGVDIDATLEVRGAITSLQPEPAVDADALARVRADLDTLNDAVENGIGLPHYGRPWLADPDAVPTGWPADLNDDPRWRGVAGLGTRMGVEAQEALIAAAVKQAGALREAGQRLGFLALGLWAAGRLWDRRLPADTHERLRVLGPVMGRMVSADNRLVLDQVTSGRSPLAPALFSSAAQRLLRHGASHTRHLSDGLDHRAALEAANRPEPGEDTPPAGLPHVDAVAAQLGLPPLHEQLQIDLAWIEDTVNHFFDHVQWSSDEYRRQRDELARAGLFEEIRHLRREWAENLFGEFIGELKPWLENSGLPCGASEILERLAAQFHFSPLEEMFLMVLDDVEALVDLRDAFERELRRCAARAACQDLLGHVDVPNRNTFCDELAAGLPPALRPEQKPVDLGLLSDRLHAALDPRQSDAPARLRLCRRLVGVDCSRLIPPEFPIGLDFPTWSLLKQYKQEEWLLPGAGTLAKDSITALQTNPAFVDAYMVGVNTQFLAEMRWRDLAADRHSTPLRMFWGQVNYATGQRQADIQPLGTWAQAPAEPLGALSHQTIPPDDPANSTGSRLVIAFRSDLFRRYPSTLVYLVKPDPAVDVDEPPFGVDTPLNKLLTSTPVLDMPPSAHPVGSDGWQADVDQWRTQNRKQIGPSFAGTLTPDTTFFVFDVTPGDLEKYWLVLDEPPAELRFRNKEPLNRSNSAAFARSALDQPTRVAISGAELENQGLNL
jgi:hypothetical protein